nr:segregation/condensation protein A [Clostridia bacterium]
MQNVLTLETNKYEIKIDNFEGPLDLLCHLIEKNKLDIFEVKISDITDQYIDYINQMEKMNLEVTSEFLIMASTLLYLKSKTLLPKETEDEEELTEEQLLQRIIDYKKYKEISKRLKENYEIFSKRIFKLPETIELPKQQLERNYEKNIIPELYAEVINKNKVRINKNAKNIQKIAITETFTVGSKVKDMYRELIRNKKFVFNRLFSIKKHNKNEVVTAFSGLLEMSRRSKVLTQQEELFGDITVTKNNAR